MKTFYHIIRDSSPKGDGWIIIAEDLERRLIESDELARRRGIFRTRRDAKAEVERLEKQDELAKLAY